MSKVIEEFTGKDDERILFEFDEEREEDPWVVEVVYQDTNDNDIECFKTEDDDRRYLNGLLYN